MSGNEQTLDPASRVVVLFTTFPVETETFLQREVHCLQKSGRKWPIHSLWSGNLRWEGTPIHRFGMIGILSAFGWFVIWLCRKPKVVTELLRMQWRRWPNRINGLENWLGLGFALAKSADFKRARIEHIHGVWASAPAMAALVIQRLVGIPYSFAGHAYDLYEDGGDGWIEEKLLEARFVRSSTQMGCERLIELGAEREKVHCIRRGLTEIPGLKPLRPPGQPIRLLAVGRLVEKMNTGAQLDLLREWKRRGSSVHLKVIGEGPERGPLEAVARQEQLPVEFVGFQPFAQIETELRSADGFLFTGKVAASGDRAGFPNAIGEAMAMGVPVFATAVGAVSEGIQDGQTGWILTGNPKEDALRILEILKEEAKVLTVRKAAHDWVCNHFNCMKNIRQLAETIEGQLGTDSASINSSQ